MPIYEYKCDNGHVFDVMQKMSDEPLAECVQCGAPARRVLTAPAVHFKGSGFYNTDYGKRKGGGNEKGGEGPASESKSSDSSSSSSDSGSSSGSKSETKAAASSGSSSSSGD